MHLFTAADIAREDRQALGRLDKAQRDALERLRMAKQMTHFRGGDHVQSLQREHQLEAERRNLKFTGAEIIVLEQPAGNGLDRLENDRIDPAKLAA